MSDLTLTATRVFQGVWEGVITRTSGKDIGAPKISVTHLGTALDDVTVTADPAQVKQWQVRVTIPAAALCDGVQTFLIRDALPWVMYWIPTSVAKWIYYARNWTC